MSKKVKKLSVTVTYKVGLGNVKVPKEVYEELVKAAEKGDEIEMHKYPEAAEWMTSNVRERDCFDWNVQIDELI